MLIQRSHSVCSRSQIFTVLADRLMWIMGDNDIKTALHYLDDYLFLDSSEYSLTLQSAGSAIFE